MEFILELLSKVASGIGPFFLLLGLLIFVHELGHYLVAVYFGVRVETFSLGFGKKIFSYKRGDTTYCLSIIPLGGYVKMYGDDPTANIPEEQKKYSFLHKPVWPRIAIVLAGPLMNLFFATLIFSIVGFLGENVSGTQLGDIAQDTPAAKAGFQSGDSILSVNGTAVNQWKEVKQFIETGTDKELTFLVKREETGTEETVTATPRLGKNEFIFSTDREVGRIDGLSLDSVSTMVGVVGADTLAAQAGLKTFDIIESINGETTTYWRQIERLLTKHASSGEWTLAVSSYDVKNKKQQNSRTIKLAATQWKPGTSPLDFLGLTRSDLFLLSVKPKSPADVAGLKTSDRVVKIDDQPVVAWQAVLDRVKSFKTEDGPIRFTISREGKEMTLPIVPERIDLPTEQGAMERRYAIGVIPAIMSAPNSAYLLRQTNPLRALTYGVAQSWEWSKLIAISFVRLIQNEVSARNIGGVITIGRVASNSFEAGIVAFLKMMAIISINLFLLNLLPVPVLDGGHLVFFTIEALKGAPISFKKLEIAQQVGMVLLLSLMLFALFNDISNLISW